MPAKESSKEKYIETVGRRKTSVARVRIVSGGRKGYTVNDKTLQDYFATDELRAIVERPAGIAGDAATMAVHARVRGGGIHSQAEAIAHGIARALTAENGELRRTLRDEKLLTRDARMKERRKFGLKKARKAPQWSKR